MMTEDELQKLMEQNEEASIDLGDQVAALFSGQNSSVVGVVLAKLTATWFVHFIKRDYLQEAVSDYEGSVRALIKAIIDEEMGRPN